MQSFDELPLELLLKLFKLLDKTEKKHLAQVNKTIHQLYNSSSAKKTTLSKLHKYKSERDHRYRFRNIIYRDREREQRITAFKSDLQAIFTDNLNCSLEFNYKRIHDHSKISNPDAKAFALICAWRNFYVFPFDFNIFPYLDKQMVLYPSIHEISVNFDWTQHLKENLDVDITYGETQKQLISIYSADDWFNVSNDSIHINLVRQAKLQKLVKAIFRTSLEANAINNKKSNHYFVALRNIIFSLLNEINFNEQINYLKLIEASLSEAEKIKETLKVPERWDIVYVWRYPEYVSIFSAEEREVKRHYKEGYHKVWHPNTESYAYGGDQLTTHLGHFSKEHIPGSGSELKYFYPNREMHAEFSNLQNIYKNTLRCLVINIITTANKNELVNFLSEQLKNEFQFLIDELLNLNQEGIDTILNNLEKDKVNFVKSYYAFLGIYYYLFNQHSKIISSKNPEAKKQNTDVEINDFIALLTHLNSNCSINTVKRHFSSTPQFSTAKVLLIFPGNHEYQNKRILLLNDIENEDFQMSFLLFKISLLHLKNTGQNIASRICLSLELNKASLENELTKINFNNNCTNI